MFSGELCVPKILLSVSKARGSVFCTQCLPSNVLLHKLTSKVFFRVHMLGTKIEPCETKREPAEAMVLLLSARQAFIVIKEECMIVLRLVLCYPKLSDGV